MLEFQTDTRFTDALLFTRMVRFRAMLGSPMPRITSFLYYPIIIFPISLKFLG